MRLLLTLGFLLWSSGTTFGFGGGTPSPAPETTSNNSGSLTSLTANKNCRYGDIDCNVCVRNVVSQFNALKHHGEVMGFHMNGAPDVTASHHWQGIQRLPGDQGQYLAVARNTENTAAFAVVKMGSRDQTGQRFRSNRLQKGKETSSTVPPAPDAILTNGMITISSDFKHAGGMQALGDILALPIDQKTGDTSVESKIVFYTMRTPANPVALNYELERQHRAGAVGLTKLDNGRFLMVVGGFDSNKTIDFYVSNTVDIFSPDFSLLDAWSSRTDALGTTIGDTTWPEDSGLMAGYQSLNFINQCDGKIFMVGTHNTMSTGAGSDRADLYQVELASNRTIQLKKVAKHHFYCDWYAAGGACSFAAAAGVYVDPAGELLLYATEHDNDGPSGTVKMAEYRHHKTNSSQTCGAGTAWVELYDDRNYSDRSVVFDWADQAKDNFENFNQLDGFNDKASSVRWCVPSGCQAVFYQHDNYKGSSYTLTDSGEISDLRNKSRSWMSNWNDEISSIKFSGICH